MRDQWEDWFQPGETLLWEGSPAPGFRNYLQNVFFTAFGIPFLGAGIVVIGIGLGSLSGLSGTWNLSTVALGVFLIAFGIPFVVVGAGMVFGSWVHDYLRPTRIRYALTNRNGYVASRMWKRSLDVLPIRKDSRIEIEENRDGTITIWFHFEQGLDSDGDRQITRKGFETLTDGHEVYRRIRNLQTGLTVDPA